MVRGKLDKKIMVETSYSELLTIAMMGKLNQVYPKGRYSVDMMYDPQSMNYHLIVHALVRGDKVKIGDMVFSDMIDHSMSWKELGDFIHVNDTMKATLMLLYGDITS